MGQHMKKVPKCDFASFRLFSDFSTKLMRAKIGMPTVLCGHGERRTLPEGWGRPQFGFQVRRDTFEVPDTALALSAADREFPQRFNLSSVCDRLTRCGNSGSAAETEPVLTTLGRDSLPIV